MELTRLKKKRITAVRGHKLLKDKRDELMRQYLDLVRENMEVRKRVEAGILSANKNFVIAKAGMSEAELHTALMAPKQEINLIPSEENVMSVRVPKLHARIDNPYGDDEGDVVYSYLASNSQMDSTIQEMGDLLPDLLKLAEIEKSCQLMADEIEKTRRRGNGLEYATIPDLKETIYYIEMKLEEAERANLVRIMKVK